MCGIFGAVNINGNFKSDDWKRFIDLTDLVSYRGPDASGYLAINMKENILNNKDRFDVFLGHRRLSIIDLSSEGNQPLTNDNNIWIIFNGEIFNYIELRTELETKGYHFKTKTDTEVILNVYKEYGEQGFSKFNGMWAFAIVDLLNKKLILSRDRFSIKPLYFINTHKKLYFASEIKQLLPLLEKKEINKDVMFKYLRQRLLDYNAETFFKGIYKVKPMHNIIIDLVKDEIKEIKYWDYSVEEIPEDENEVAKKFRDLFIDSVKIRLRSDVPIGGLLSGGLDSSSICVITNELTNGSFSCFSVVSKDKKYSEEKFVDILKDNKNLKVEKLFLESESSWKRMEELIQYYDEPFGGFSVIAQNQMFEQIKKNTGVTVILSGQGGDEILGGYRKFFFFYLQEELKKGNIFNVFKNIIFSAVYGTVLWQFSLSEAKRYIPFMQHNYDPIEDILLIKGELEPIWKVKNFKDRQKLDISKYSVPALAHYEDRNSMAYSLETRLPFLDHRLVNFALNIPPSMKIKNGWTKYILRKSMTELPKEISWRRDKQGFITPEEKWLKYDFNEKIMNLFMSSRLNELKLIDKNKLLDLYKNFLRGDNRISSSDIARFVIAELWVRKNIEYSN